MNEKRSMMCRAPVIAFTLGIGLLLAPGAWGQEQDDSRQNASQDMSGMESMEGMDHSGHVMAPELLDELRAKVPLYEHHTDQQLALSMERMGGNFDVYLSGENMTGEVGLLVLAHGFGEKGNEAFNAQVESMAGVFPTAIGYGMSMLTSAHIQAALDKLTQAGAKKIIVVPALSTRHNSLLRQWQYIFGLRDEADYASVPRVHTEAEIVLTSPLDDNPLVAEAMLDFANDLSTNPANELVILVGHGPSFEQDNLEELAMLETFAGYMTEDSDFSEIKWITLQDDAPRVLRDKNVAQLRAMVEQAMAEGKDTLIVTNLMATRSIQAKMRADLKGLDYKFATKGITQHPNFIKWLGEAVHDVLLYRE